MDNKHFGQQRENGGIDRSEVVENLDRLDGGRADNPTHGPKVIVEARRPYEPIPNGSKPSLQHLIFEVLNELDDVTREDLLDTPRRIAEAYKEFYTFKNVPLVSVLKEGFENVSPDGGMVVQSDIPFRLLCPHHFMPAMGTAAIGYIARRRIVGLSKLTRLVQAAGTTRPDTQEAVTNNIANALVEGLDPVGVIVITKAVHSCMSTRGINAPGVATSVSAVRGVFRDVPAARQEFFSLIRP